MITEMGNGFYQRQCRFEYHAPIQQEEEVCVHMCRLSLSVQSLDKATTAYLFKSFPGVRLDCHVSSETTIL